MNSSSLLLVVVVVVGAVAVEEEIAVVVEEPSCLSWSDDDKNVFTTLIGLTRGDEGGALEEGALDGNRDNWGRAFNSSPCLLVSLKIIIIVIIIVIIKGGKYNCIEISKRMKKKAHVYEYIYKYNYSISISNN